MPVGLALARSQFADGVSGFVIGVYADGYHFSVDIQRGGLVAMRRGLYDFHIRFITILLDFCQNLCYRWLHERWSGKINVN